MCWPVQAKLLLALADLMTTVTNPRSNILVAGAKTVSTTATVAPTTTPEPTTAAPTTAGVSAAWQVHRMLCPGH